MLGALLACVVAMAQSIPPELDAYVKRPDPSFAWSAKEPGLAPLHLRMTSQIWQNVRWTHDIVVAYPERAGSSRPDRGSKAGTAILYITGGEPNPADRAEAQRLANLAGMPVAHLFQIPNQPLYGKNEDDLIAHTFEKFLQTGEADWILLFPMVKSAVRAMDALQQATAKSGQPLKRFVVTGASKRGWTAWLVAAIQDPRVIGIAPMVFDNLRFKEQLRNQLDSWGKYSEMIADYTDRGLDKILDTPAGQRLVALSDPWTYRARMSVPKLIVNGANDRYWCTDALSLYWEALPGPKYCSIVPNAGHLLGDMSQALAAIAAFSRSCAGEFEMPSPKATVQKLLPYSNPRAVQWRQTVEANGEGLLWVRFWTARASDLDFRSAVWQATEKTAAIPSGGTNDSTYYDLKEAPSAVFPEFRFRRGGLEFSLTAPVLMHRGRSPDR